MRDELKVTDPHFLAKMISLACLAVALGGVTDGRFFSRVAEDIGKGGAISVLAGILALLIGGSLVNYYNICCWDFRGLLTVLGWLALLKGFIILVWPRFFRLLAPYLEGRWMAGVAFVFSLFFGYHGFGR